MTKRREIIEKRPPRRERPVSHRRTTRPICHLFRYASQTAYVGGTVGRNIPPHEEPKQKIRTKEIKLAIA